AEVPAGEPAVRPARREGPRPRQVLRGVRRDRRPAVLVGVGELEEGSRAEGGAAGPERPGVGSDRRRRPRRAAAPAVPDGHRRDLKARDTTDAPHVLSPAKAGEKYGAQTDRAAPGRVPSASCPPSVISGPAGSSMGGLLDFHLQRGLGLAPVLVVLAHRPPLAQPDVVRPPRDLVVGRGHHHLRSLELLNGLAVAAATGRAGGP